MSASVLTEDLNPPVAHERALLWCLLASLGLHALVLLGLSPGGRSAPPAATLLVLTARLGPVAVATSPAAPQPARPEASSAPRPVLAKPALAPAPGLQRAEPPEPARSAAPETAPSAPAASASAPAASASAAASAAPAETRPAAQAPAAVPSVEASAKSGSDADTGTLDQYRLALIVATRRYKRYPAIAMEKGWQGRVEVHMVIGANGMLASVTIKSSSGHEVLDSQALDMLRKGKTTVQIPASLRGREFAIDVPVVFSLDNPNA